MKPRPVEARTSSRFRGSTSISYSEDAMAGEMQKAPSVKSENSSLSDLSDIDAASDGGISEMEEKVEDENDASNPLSAWDAMCVTLKDWQSFPDRFAQSAHPDEKAMYRTLTKQICPQVIGELEEKERKRLLEVAVNNRKRSSRIADKEFEREQRLQEERRQAEQHAKLERLRTTEDHKVQEEKVGYKLAALRRETDFPNRSRGILSRNEKKGSRSANCV